MTDSLQSPGPSLLGPRGWAILVLAGGAALAAPFLRNPNNPTHTKGNAANPSELDFSKKSWPDVREKALTPEGPVATNLNAQDWAELERLKAHSGTGPRKLTGNLPSTSATPLPAWAERSPRIDQLVNNSIRTEPLAPVPASSAGLDPLRPWMGSGMKAKAEGSASSTQGPGFSNTASSNTGTSNGLSSDFVFHAPNPDARWNSIPSTATNSSTLPPDDSNHDSGALASNLPFRKFEDHVEQWPDEKMPIQQVLPNQHSSGQVAWGQPNTQPLDTTTVSPNSVWPPATQPSATQPSGYVSNSQPYSPGTLTNQPLINQPLNNQPVNSQPLPLFANPATVPPTPDTVSAPMVSSQSGRQAPRLNGPTIQPPKIESPKPVSPTPPRQKHFIQQPTKRA
ncbi:MAG: hypothetical protein SFV81_19760 [Pirellulaceae bacterium]|nr:hypothetical protein [Pirellulaceae bacterium]